jgi:hypothetical protein
VTLALSRAGYSIATFAAANGRFRWKAGSVLRRVSAFALMIGSGLPSRQKPLALTTSLPARVVRTCQT